MKLSRRGSGLPLPPGSRLGPVSRMLPGLAPGLLLPVVLPSQALPLPGLRLGLLVPRLLLPVMLLSQALQLPGLLLLLLAPGL